MTYRMYLVLFSALCAPGPARASEIADSLQLISGTADRVCAAVQTSGASVGAEASGTVTAELGKLFKLLAPNISANGKVAAEGYAGLLQRDLPQAFHDLNACKLAVFTDLSAKLIPIKECEINNNTFEGSVYGIFVIGQPPCISGNHFINNQVDIFVTPAPIVTTNSPTNP